MAKRLVLLIILFSMTFLSCDYIFNWKINGLMREGLYDVAREKCLEKLNLEKKSGAKAELLFKIGETFEKEKKIDEALDYYVKAYREEPAKTEKALYVLGFANKMKLDKKVLALANDFIKNFNLSKTVKIKFFLALSHFRLEEYSAAEALFKEIISETTDKKLLSQAYCYFAEMNTKLNSVELAFSQLKKALELDNMNARAYASIGILLAGQEKYEEAKNFFEKSISLAKEKPEPEVYYNLGQLYEIEKKYDLALEMYEDSIRIEPDLLESHFKLALLYIEKSDYKFARFHLEKIKKINIMFCNTDKLFGKIEILERNFDEAIGTLQKGLRLFPQDEENLYYLALAYGNIGRFNESLQSLLKLEKNNVKYKDLFAKIADLYVILGKKVEAQKYYEKELGRDTFNLVALIGLAKLEAMNKKPSMKKIYELIMKAVNSGFRDIDNLRQSPFLQDFFNSEYGSKIFTK